MTSVWWGLWETRLFSFFYSLSPPCLLFSFSFCVPLACLSVCRLWHSPFILEMTIRLIMSTEILNYSFFQFSISILQRLLKPSERNVVLLSFCSFRWGKREQDLRRDAWSIFMSTRLRSKRKNVLCAATASCKTTHRDLRTTVMYRVVLREDWNLPCHWNCVQLVGVLHLWSCPLTTSADSDVRVQCTCTMQASTHLTTHDVQGVHQKVSSAAPHPSKFGTTLN